MKPEAAKERIKDFALELGVDDVIVDNVFSTESE